MHTTCLIIDDDQDDREIFLAVLETIAPACQCITAVNGQDALEKLISKKIDPDIIFLDLNMHLMDGSQFLSAIKQVQFKKAIPIIVLTTSSDKATRARVLQLGATQFVTKPDTFFDWERVLKEQLQDQQIIC
jgi:CheY-like chemotaxis protein